MEICIGIPATVDDLDALIWRLEMFDGISVRVEYEANRIRVSGLADKLLHAQNYALRFIGPESLKLVHVSPECLSLFHVPGMIRHVEHVFNVILCLKNPQSVVLKGRKSDNERFDGVLKKLDSQCHFSSASLTSFKLSSLRLLCHKFGVDFDKLPSSPAVQMALLVYFSSLPDITINRTPMEEQPLSYLEVYRNTPILPLSANQKPGPKQAEARNRTRCDNEDNRSSPMSGFRSAVEKPPNSSDATVSHLPHSNQFTTKTSDIENVQPVNIDNKPSVQLRNVVIDGSNVAFAHGRQKEFSPEGIWLALQFFIKRGHTNVVAVVPRYRRGRGGELFDRLERLGYLTYSSSRFLNDAHQVADDDRIILQLAVESNAVVVSNDQYRNYRDENEQFKEVIDHRLLQYTLALDTFLVAEDPHGAKGPRLSECLRIPSES